MCPSHYVTQRYEFLTETLEFKKSFEQNRTFIYSEFIRFTLDYVSIKRLI